jgi:hypothetical protein
MRWEGDSSSGRLTLEPAPVPLGHVAAPGPPGGMLVPLHGKSGWVREVPDPYGGSEAPAYQFGAFFPQGHVASPDLSQAGNGSGAVGLVR